MNLIDAAIIIEAQAKLIKQQSIEITTLEQKLEQKEYNRRFTNTKFIKTPSIEDTTKWIATLNPKKIPKEVKKK